MDRRRFSTTVMASAAGLFSTAFGARQAVAQTLVSQDAPLETWQPTRRPSPAQAADSIDRHQLARRIWDSYDLALPNHYDTVEAFCGAIVSDWARDRSAFVWRYASVSGPQVYVLPSRFMLNHPPFVPDFPDGYYRLDPDCEADDAQSCIHPSAFFRILSRQSVDEYLPAQVVPTRG